MVSVGNADQLQAEVGEKDDGCSLPETKGELAEACCVVRVSFVL